jgi:hypothetical protein
MTPILYPHTYPRILVALTRLERLETAGGNMVKRTILTMALLVANLSVSAFLLDRSGGKGYHIVVNVTWLQDANYAQTNG